MQKLRLGWANIDEDRVALVFDKDAWKAVELVAKDQGMNPREMIIQAIANCMGTIVGRGPIH
jgi:hypothetical protein